MLIEEWTWSIIFHDRSSGRIAIAVATKFFAVGGPRAQHRAAKKAPCARRRWTNSALRPARGFG